MFGPVGVPGGARVAFRLIGTNLQHIGPAGTDFAARGRNRLGGAWTLGRSGCTGAGFAADWAGFGVTGGRMYRADFAAGGRAGTSWTGGLVAEQAAA